ncbi:MAG: hypothetical protein VKJ85_09710 [Prochlorothrix sp.]|nr:hypothetical protein [Prochlorothrix sp.]
MTFSALRSSQPFSSQSLVSENPALPLGSMPISAAEAFQGAVLGAVLAKQGLGLPGPMSPQHNQGQNPSQLFQEAVGSLGDRSAPVQPNSRSSPGSSRLLTIDRSSDARSWNLATDPFLGLLAQVLQTYGASAAPVVDASFGVDTPVAPVNAQADADPLDGASLSAALTQAQGIVAPSAPAPIPVPHPAHPALTLALHCFRTSPHSWPLTVRRCWFLGRSGPAEQVDRAFDDRFCDDRSLALILAATLAGFALGSRAIPLPLLHQLDPDCYRSALSLSHACLRRWAGALSSDRSLPSLSLHCRRLVAPGMSDRLDYGPR